MTGQSQFNQRSDNAALRLKGEMNARNQGQAGWQPLESSPVAVGPDGKPPPTPPPAGSYVRQAHDRQQQQQAAQAMGEPSAEQQVGQQPVAGTPLQQSDGSVAPPLTPETQQPAAPADQSQNPPLTENANNRIQGLINELREKDSKIAELSGSQTEVAQLKEQMQTLLAERENFLKNHLDELDPDERVAVLARANTQEMIDRNNATLLEQVQRAIGPLQQQNQQTEMERTAAKYPGFDMQIHPVLIDQVRAKNPGLTYEMAFKAVAEGDEAVTREQAAHVAVPPVVPAGNGATLPRYMPEPQPNPEDALVDFQQRTNKLIRSDQPVDRRQGLRQMDQLIAERLRGASYEGKPGVFD